MLISKHFRLFFLNLNTLSLSSMLNNLSEQILTPYVEVNFIFFCSVYFDGSILILLFLSFVINLEMLIPVA